MKVILDHAHFIPVWISHPYKFLNPGFSHLLNLPQKYLFSALFYGIFSIIKRNNFLNIHWIWVFVFFALITIQSACIKDSSLAEYDPTSQFNNLLANGIFDLVFKYEMGIRIISLYDSYKSVIPSYYSGSLDGEFMWATLLHSYSLKDLYPWIWWKYLAVFTDSFCVCIGLVSNAQITWFVQILGLIVHWTRKLRFYYHVIFGSHDPWLLWVPDTIVLTAAFLFDLGLFFGVSKDEQLYKKSRKKKKNFSNRIYHTRSALSNPARAVKELANSLSKKY